MMIQYMHTQYWTAGTFKIVKPESGDYHGGLITGYIFIIVVNLL